MAIYLVLAAFPLVLGYAFPDLNEDKQQKRRFYIICGIAMFVVMGCRNYSLGSADTTHYYEAMKRAIQSTTWSNFYNPDSYEIGSQFFIYGLSRVFKDPQWLLVITSLIYIIVLFYFVDHNSKDIALSIVLFITLGLFTFELQGMRQSLAMCICLFAYEQAKKRHLIPFIILVTFATLFHQTAIVFLIVYILCGLKYNGRTIVILMIASVIIFSSLSRIMEFANTLFDREYYDTVSSGGFIAVAVYLIIILLTVVWNEDIKDGNEQTPAFFMLLAGVVCYLMRYFGALAAERISFYFMFSQLVLLPNAQEIVVEDQKDLMRILIAFISIILFAYRLNGSEFLPYSFCW
ncbi:MAG: EpsG family protein [Lachnospiraceae bacterium]|nr:EpsG family protein [Lachnospiraceae bacterium]